MLGGCAFGVLAALVPVPARAQGCIVARQSAPTLAGDDPYLLKSEWLISATYRSLRADTHFRGIDVLEDRQRLRNNVVNKQQILDLGATYAVSRRFNVTLAVPILTYGSWSVPVPVDPPGPRQVQSANGFGDISLTGRYWVLDTERYHRGNVGLGVGIKAPTGDSDAKDRFPDASGRNFSVMPVDQSIQPGDGGWGLNLELQAFRQVGEVTFFASGDYLVNPRNTNRTESSVLFLCGGVIPPNLQRFKYNSVPDQYLARAGVVIPIRRARGLSLSLAVRMEGVPREDLIGGNDGFRRPGYAIFLEPGLTYNRGAHTFSLSMPVATQRNLEKTVGGYQPDGTIADYFLLLGYNYRFGRSRHRMAAHPAPATTDPSPFLPSFGPYDLPKEKGAADKPTRSEKSTPP